MNKKVIVSLVSLAVAGVAATVGLVVKASKKKASKEVDVEMVPEVEEEPVNERNSIEVPLEVVDEVDEVDEEPITVPASFDEEVVGSLLKEIAKHEYLENVFNKDDIRMLNVYANEGVYECLNDVYFAYLKVERTASFIIDSHNRDCEETLKVLEHSVVTLIKESSKTLSYAKGKVASDIVSEIKELKDYLEQRRENLEKVVDNDCEIECDRRQIAKLEKLNEEARSQK